MKTFSLVSLAAVLCLTLSSCVPTSESPLSPVETAHADPALIGDWLDKIDQETYRITAKDGAWMHVDILKVGTKIDSYDFYPTQIGSNTFANIVMVSKDNPNSTKRYTFIRYSLSEKGRLKMWSMADYATVAAVKAGKLKGVVDHEHRNPDVYLWDNSADLTKFIQTSNLDELFTNEATLVQVKP